MRPIEFRAWWIKEKRMINDLEAIYPKGKCAGILGVKLIKGESLWNFEDIELMQFTGLLDKNGKKIFEGDIVKIYFPEPHIYENQSIMAVIEYSPGCFWWRGIDKKITDCNWHFYNAEDRVVIGNIYENPGLIK